MTEIAAAFHQISMCSPHIVQLPCSWTEPRYQWAKSIIDVFFCELKHLRASARSSQVLTPLPGESCYMVEHKAKVWNTCLKYIHEVMEYRGPGKLPILL